MPDAGYAPTPGYPSTGLSPAPGYAATPGYPPRPATRAIPATGTPHPSAPTGLRLPRAGKTNGLAIASLVCVARRPRHLHLGAVGAIMGHVARRQIRERGEDGDGMALAGIIVGWIAVRR